jgi:hypothetical protein
MKRIILIVTIMTTLSFASFFAHGQHYEEVVYLKNGSIIRGAIIEEIPNVSIKIKTYDNSVFSYKMDEIDKITKELSDKPKISGGSSKSYIEYYFFGGFSSKKLVETGVITINDPFYSPASYDYEIYYKNGGLGGVGLDWLIIGKDRRPDVTIDLEASLYGAKMTTTIPEMSLTVEMDGLALCSDMHVGFFPIKARNKFPSPFVFAGLGLRVLTLSADDIGGTSATEVHGELPFGIGVRQKISDVVSFQIKERFVYSTLKDVGGFILPETRFELVLSFGN